MDAEAASTLREVRKKAGVGLEKCARLADTDVRTLVRYEQGKSKPGIVNAAKISRGLGVRIDEVLEFVPALREIESIGFTLVETDSHSKDGKVE